MERRRSRAHTGAVSETPNPLPPEAPSGVASARNDGPASGDRPGSRWGRLVAALLVSVLVGALTFVLMAVGGAF